MKEFIIKIEVDDNITLNDIEDGVVEMSDNILATTQCLYEIEEVSKKEEKITNVLTNIEYVSVWDGYGEVWSTCSVNMDTKEVYDIEAVDVDIDDAVLIAEYIVIDGKKYEVFNENDFDIDDEYWDEENEEWTYYWYC